MAEALRDEVAAGSAEPAGDVRPDPAGASASTDGTGAAPGKLPGPGQLPAADETKPRPDEVRPAPEGPGQGTSLHADLKGEVRTTTKDDTGTPPDRQAVSEAQLSSTADEVQEEALNYEPFWKATERGASSSQKPEIPRRRKKKIERPSIIAPKEPTIVEQGAEDTSARKTDDSPAAEFQISDKSSNLGTTTTTSSTLSVKKQDRGERLAEKEDVAQNTMGEQPGTVESIVSKQQSSTRESTAIDSTKDGDRLTPVSVSGHETNVAEAEATTKKREITPSKPLLTSATSISNCTQSAAIEGTESTDEKPDSSKKSSSGHGWTSKKSDQVGETDGPLSSDSIKAVSITLRPETGGRELESMTEASEATLKVIPLSESLHDKRSTNKAKKVAHPQQTQPGEVNEVSELSTGVQEDAIGVPPERSEVSQVSVDSKMESTTTENEASKLKAPTSNKSKKQTSFVEPTSSNNAAQKPTEEAPLSETASQDDSCREQLPMKTSEGTGAKGQIQRKQSNRKETKKDSQHKQEAVSEPPDVNTGASADVEVTVDDLHMSKTDTETRATDAKEAASSEEPTLPNTVSGQKSGCKETKKQPRRKRSAVDTSKSTVPPAESVVEPSTAATTEHGGSGVLPPSECTEVSSKGIPVDGMNAKVQSQKTTGPQKANRKNMKKTVAKAGSTSKLGSGRQKTEDTVAPVTASSTTEIPTKTESMSSITTKKDVTKTESDNANRNQKRNVKATKTQQEKGKSVVATTKCISKLQQQAERISNENSTNSVRDDTAEVKTVVESEKANTKLAKTSPGQKLNNKMTKTAAKKSVQPPVGDSQKDIRSSQEADLKTECATGTSVANDENVSPSNTFSDQKKSNTKTKKDKMKPADGVSDAEKESVKATESQKNETVPSGGDIQNIQTVELVTQASEGDQHGSNEESQKTAKLTQEKPERRNAPARENKRKTAAKTNEKQSTGTAQKETSRDNSETKENKPTEMQESGAKGESTNRDTKNSDSRPSNRNRARNKVTLIVNRVELANEVDMSDCPVAPNETSPESTVNGESSTVHAAADTTRQDTPTTVPTPRKNSSSQKKARKAKASWKKLELVCKDSEKEPPISSNEISSTNPDRVADTIKTEGTDVELESTVSAAKSVAAKTRISKSPSDLKRKSKVANPQLKKSSSLVAISKSKSKPTLLVDGAKVPASGDTGLTKAKKVSLKKSESFSSVDNIKGQSTDDHGRLRIWSLKQQKICREQGKRQTSPSKGKNTKEEDSVLELQQPSSKAISSFSKEGKTVSNTPAALEASESALKNVKIQEENKHLATLNSDEADVSRKSPRKSKADQNTKESIQSTGTGDVDRPAKIESKAPQEKSVESAEVARLTPGGKPESPGLRRHRVTQPKEETKATPETKVPDAGEDTTKKIKDVTEAKPHAAQKGDSSPATGLPKRGNSPRKRTDEDVVAEAQQKTVCVKHETRANDRNKLNNMDSTQKKPGQAKHETVPTTVTVTLKTGDNKGSVNKSAGDTVKIGETVECTISASAAKKKEQRSSKPREQPEQTSKVGEKIAASGSSTVSGDGVKGSAPRKQTAEQKDLKVKAKKMEGICVVIEEVSQEQKSKTLEKAEAGSHKKQHVGSNQEQLTSAKDTGLPPSSPRKSPRKSPRGVPKTAATLKSPEINSLETEETKEGAHIAIVEIEENDVKVSVRDKQKSLSPRNAVEKASSRETNPSPRSKQTTVKKGINPSVRAYENSEDMADACAQKRNGSNPSGNSRNTSPQRLISQLRTFMTQASLLNKLDLKTKILDCIGVNQVRDGYKMPASHGKIKTPTTVVTDLKKVAAALKVGRKRLEDQTGGKVVSIGAEESKKELLEEVGVKSSVAMAEEPRIKLISKPRSFRGGKHRDRKSTTGSSCFSSSSDTPKPVALKERARKRKVRAERKGVPRMKFSETTSGLTTSSSRPSHSYGGRRPRWASATPEIPARVKQVSPRRHAGGTEPKIPVGIVSSTMLALRRMRPDSVEKGRPHSPSPSRRPSSKPLSSATAAIMAVTMKAREIAKVPRHETEAATERRSRSPRSVSKTKRAAATESDKKRNWKPEQRTHEIVIRGLTAASAGYSAADRTDDLLRDFAPVHRATKRRERSSDDYDRTPIIGHAHSEEDKPISPRRVATERVMPTWHSGSSTSTPRRQSSRSPTCEKSPTLSVLHDDKRPVRTKTTVIKSSPAEVPCSVAITKKTSVPASSVKRATRKGAGPARASIEHVVNIDIRMGSLAKDSTASEDGRGRPGSLAAKSSVATKDSSVGTEGMQVLDVCIKALPAAGDETSVETLLRAKELSEVGGGDVDDAGRDSSESILAISEMQVAGSGDRVSGYGADGEGDEDSGGESDVSAKTWPPATLVMPTTKLMAASFPRFSTSSVPEEAARTTAALERSLRLVSRACESRPLECDLRWSAWMSALHAGDPDAAATPFPASLQRAGRRDVDSALAAAVRVPALWLLAGLRAQELGARTVKLLHWLLVRLPAEGPALKAVEVHDLQCPCQPSAAFKVRVCAGSALDARLRWRSRGLPAFEAWASPPPWQLHALVCGGAATPVGVLSLTLTGALRRAQPGYGCGASRLGSRLRCVLKCDVAHHPELVERIGADAVVVRGMDLVRVRQLLVFSEPLPEGALAAWAARAIKKRRLAVAVAAILLTYLLVAAVVWMADLGVVTLGEGPDLFLGRLLSWADEPEQPAAPQTFSFWA